MKSKKQKMISMVVIIIVFLIVVSCVQQKEEKYDSEAFIDKSFKGAPLPESLTVLGYTGSLNCYFKQCRQEWLTAFGKMEVDFIKNGQEMEFYTDKITNIDTDIILVFKVKMFGSGILNWYVGNNFILRSETVSKSDEWVSDYSSVKLTYDYIDENSGFLKFHINKDLVKKQITKEGRLKLRVQLLGGEYFAIIRDELNELIFKEGKKEEFIYGYKNLDYCYRVCNKVYDTFLGYQLVDFAFKGEQISFFTPKVDTRNYSDYVVFYFYASWFGNSKIDWYLNDQYIITSYAINGSSSYINKGYKIEFDYKGYKEGYSGMIKLYVPEYLVNNKENKITARVETPGWIGIYRITKNDIEYLGNATVQKEIGLTRIIECNAKFCNITYPLLDRHIKQNIIYDGENITFSTAEIKEIKSDIVDFTFVNVQYGNASLKWYFNENYLFNTLITKENKVYVNGPYRLSYEYIGYKAGNIGKYDLLVPKVFVNEKNNITVSVSGDGWFAVKS